MTFIKKHIKALCMALSLLVLAVTILNDDELRLGLAAQPMIIPMYALLALGVAVVPLLLEGLLVYVAQRRLGFGMRAVRCVGDVLMSRCLGALTPMNAAAHPSLIMYLKRGGVSTGAAGSVSVLRYVFFQGALLALGIAALVMGNGGRGTAMSVGIALGFLINALPVLLLLVLSLNKRVGLAVLDVCLKPFRKRGDAWKARSIGQYEAFRDGFAVMKTVDLLCFSCLALLQALFTLSIPYVAIIACGGETQFVNTLFVASLLMLTFTAVPLPGGTGIAESGFLRLMAEGLPSRARISALLIWRGATYYLVILLGGLCIFYDYIKGRRHNDAGY